MQDIASYSTFKTIEPINRGWSRDQKYRVETQDGRTLLLRVADISQHDRKQTEVAMMKQAAALGIPMSVPLEFGTCNDGKSVYGLLTWCEGEDAEVVLPRLPVMEQYLLGVDGVLGLTGR